MDITANPRIQRWAGLLILLTMFWTLAMMIQASQFDKGTRLGKWASPVGPMELADSAKDVTDLLAAGNQQVNIRTLQYNTYMDCVFIVLYGLSFIFLANIYRGIRVISVLTTILVVIAMIFDYWENCRMLCELSDLKGLSDPRVHMTHVVSLVKWVALALTLVFLAVIMWKASRAGQKSRALKALSILLLLAGVSVFIGVNDIRFLALWLAFLTPALVLAIYLFRPFQPFPETP